MLNAVLSLVFFGVVPLAGNAPVADVQPLDVSVASPSTFVALLAPLLEQQRALSASGVVIIDLQSGQTLYTHHANLVRPMASLTKLMTALIIAENHDLSEWVRVPSPLPPLERSTIVLRAGEQYRVGEVLDALLVHSANEAAVSLAVFHSGSEEKFVEEMNARAKDLGLTNTSFANSMGFDHPAQYSTPQEIAWLATYVLRRPELRERMSKPSAFITSKQGSSVTVTQTHQLLTGSSNVIAGKTGTTDAAGQCLLSIVQEGSREYLVVLLASKDRYRDMRTVLAVLRQLLV